MKRKLQGLCFHNSGGTMGLHGSCWGVICFSTSSGIKCEETLYLYQRAETHQNGFHADCSSGSRSSSKSDSVPTPLPKLKSRRDWKLEGSPSTSWTTEALRAGTRVSCIFRVKDTAVDRYNHTKKRNFLSFTLLLLVLLCCPLNQTLGKHRQSLEHSSYLHIIQSGEPTFEN